MYFVCPHRFTEILAPFLRISRTLNSKPKIERLVTDASAEHRSALKNDAIVGRIEFQDVHFAYPAEPDKMVLKGLSFVAEAGQKVSVADALGLGSRALTVQIFSVAHRLNLSPIALIVTILSLIHQLGIKRLAPRKLNLNL